MNRKLLVFFIFLIISLLAGCGGSSGGGSETPPIEKGPSTDYMGLQVGAKLIYKVVETPGDLVSTDTYEVIENNSETFKTKYTSTEDPDDAFGLFIKKEADGSYSQTGRWDWDLGEEKLDMYPPEKVYTVMVNPINVGFVSGLWGTVLRQEPVKVTNRTFNAWLFYKTEPCDEDEDGTNESTFSVYYWFVLNLGIVKSYGETTRDLDSEKIDSVTSILESYSFE